MYYLNPLLQIYLRPPLNIHQLRPWRGMLYPALPTLYSNVLFFFSRIFLGVNNSMNEPLSRNEELGLTKGKRKIVKGNKQDDIKESLTS